ncbi:hypothetical protein PF007_g967, partial [Phytophthora fragariae]
MPLGQHRPHSSICAAGEEPRDQQQRQQQQQHCRTRMGLIQAPPGSRAGHCSTATMTGSSSIAGVDASPAWKPSWPLQHRHHDRQQLQQQQHCRGRCK